MEDTCHRCNQKIERTRIPGLVWAWCGCLPNTFKQRFMELLNALGKEVKQELVRHGK